MLVDYGGGHYFPSFATQLVAAYYNLKPSDVHVRMGGGIVMGKVTVPTDASFKMLVNYHYLSDKPAFATYSISDVLNQKVQPAAFKDKIVIIGLTHLGLGEQVATPVAARLPQPEVVANAVENILHQKDRKSVV